ncbi:MAG: transcription antitermination factor NusB [Candidatus Absconditabacteria bacterium]|nr:transcription antitermination factor NusB [Candidatus Absconditabacteria bacterium]MDD3868201.1 transcription antitermination factor NusB [Candidatus Absconditabacteria bacterium]
MQIHKRINARKIVLSYLYQRLFLLSLEQKIQADPELEIPSIEGDHPFFDEKFLEEIQRIKIAGANENQAVKINLHDMEEQSLEYLLPYYLKNFFDRWTEEDIDLDYILQIGSNISLYLPKVSEVVDTYTTTFKYIEMDAVDQAIFLLGYIERKIIDTPKEILMNEMIELGKRYSGEGSPKLINGIFHKILNA